MQFIEELVEYFSELITEEQKSAVGRLFGIGAQSEVHGRSRDSDEADDSDDFDEYDKYDEYEFPATDRKHGHASGKRRPLRHPAITAVGLVEAFRKLASAHWKSTPFAHRLFVELAEIRDKNYLAGRGRASEWRRFTAAVSCLRDLDVDTLVELIRQRFAREQRSGDGNDLFYIWFILWRNGDFTRLADTFCRIHVEGVAGRAVLAALRGIAYPENAEALRNTNVFRPFLDNPELVGIFDYYRVLRKLEYIQRQTVEEATRRLKKGYY